MSPEPSSGNGRKRETLGASAATNSDSLSTSKPQIQLAFARSSTLPRSASSGAEELNFRVDLVRRAVGTSAPARRVRKARAHLRSAARQLEVASTLSVQLAGLDSVEEIAQTVVGQLHSAFGYHVAVIREVVRDELHVVAAAGRVTVEHGEFATRMIPLRRSIVGRTARTGRIAIVNDTGTDPDYFAAAAPDVSSELCAPIFVRDRVWGVLTLGQRRAGAFSDHDRLLANAVVAQAGAAIDRCNLLASMEEAFSTTLGLLCDTLESKDPYTASHAARVAELAVSVAAALGLAEHELQRVHYCALLHDIGKIGIATEILNKPGPLTAGETREMRRHSVIGAELLGRIPPLTQVAPLVRAVHERWDGSGYPDGLGGEQIPIEARVVTVCDAWHAMIEDRVYRRALDRPSARAELQRNAGTQFDPVVVAMFLNTVEQYTVPGSAPSPAGPELGAT